MSINPDIDDLISGGAAAFKFETIGDTCRGRVVRADTQQQTDFNTSMPKTFPDGKPMMQIVVTVEQDNGEETALYFKGGNFEVKEGTGQSSLSALRDALGDRKLEVGGMLAMQFTGLGKPKVGNPPKLYVCQYQPPTNALPPGVDLL
jgi:hypothetical protein